MRILIIKWSGFGELVDALPVLDYLKQAVPGIEVDWAVDEALQPLLMGHPQLSLLHTVRPEAWRRRPLASSTRKEMTLLREALQERAYDLVFDLQGDLNSGLIGKLTGCPDRIGFDKDELKEALNAFFSSRRIPMRRQDSHRRDKYLRLVSVPFAKEFREMELCATVATSPEEDAQAEALLATLSDGLVFLFQCGSSWQTRLWSDAGWTGLGREIVERFPEATILFPWGDEAEKARVTEIAAGIGRDARVIERHTLKELAALLKKVDLVVGVDSGPLQLAAALGTPTVSLYRATDARRVGPRGGQHVVIQSPMHCARCLRINCDKDLQCRETVKVATVLAGVEKLLSEPS